MAEPARSELEYACPSPSGPLWFLMTVTPFDRQGGGAVVSHLDITRRKRAEQALRESEERYRAVVQDQTELICRWLPDTTLTFVNDAYCHYFGKVRPESSWACCSWCSSPKQIADRSESM